ncbi:PhzF family phenazine biosynthesis protein [Natronoflexus pectinivorans]|uniref:PhzF family phenazine biosynthesis protein n=1 Tax=Natronoflexus pectinivorans TaxID=682526 RepID=A0A4R2G4W3_9BACT|nr:PhzF family phenazine biosynthesis protein [Natronoflexus pectinivorans]TCO02441.1 PhzF family phenazine biosynthesis protein [Natronoflexus pectinivorans]
MKEYNFKKIDAFATKKSDGNPAGYVLLNSLNDISENEMLQIAKELKGFVNEVGYVAKVGECEFDLRYYSSEREVDFCGHATVAILYDLIKANISLANAPTLTINTNKGTLKVENRLIESDSVFIMSPKPETKDISIDVSELAGKLKIDRLKIDMNNPISVINAGLSTLIVPITDLESILSITPALNELKDYCFRLGIDIIEVFTSEVSDKTSDYRTRVFAPTFGYLEDPATGSGNSAFGYYLAINNMWPTETLTIEQNGLKDNFNVVKLQKQVDEDNIQRVCFGGGAITRIEGKYMIYK